MVKRPLKLDISEEKSKIVDIRNSNSEFLGFKFKARMKNKKYVIQSHMSDKAIEKCKTDLKKSICELKKNPTSLNVMKYNSKVLGMQNYYKAATNISVDMSYIGYVINKTMRCRLRYLMTKTS